MRVAADAVEPGDRAACPPRRARRSARISRPSARRGRSARRAAAATARRHRAAPSPAWSGRSSRSSRSQAGSSSRRAGRRPARIMARLPRARGMPYSSSTASIAARLRTSAASSSRRSALSPLAHAHGDVEGERDAGVGRPQRRQHQRHRRCARAVAGQRPPHHGDVHRPRARRRRGCAPAGWAGCSRHRPCSREVVARSRAAPAHAPAAGWRRRRRPAARRCCSVVQRGSSSESQPQPRDRRARRRRRRTGNRARGAQHVHAGRGTPRTMSQSPAFSVSRTKPRRCATRCSDGRRPAPAPASARCGSRTLRRARWRRAGCSGRRRRAARAPRRAAPRAQQAATSSGTVGQARRHRASRPWWCASGRSRIALHQAERGGGVARVEVGGDDGARPAADAGQDGDILLAVRARDR